MILVSFYKFVKLVDVTEIQTSLLALCEQQQLKGTILLASEGINATIAGETTAVEKLINFLRRDSRFVDLEVKTCEVNSPPFERMKVKIKKQIITFGSFEVDPTEKVGTYVTPQQWNELISDPEVTVVDTRNEYEVKIGSFKGAQNPHIDSFKKFPEYIHQNLAPQKQKKVALFCTGGIRCEKATSLMLSEGFQEVYHLQGGILKYLQEVPAEESLWEGECFVFDERVAVKNGLAPGSYQLCPDCGQHIPDNLQRLVLLRRPGSEPLTDQSSSSPCDSMSLCNGACDTYCSCSRTGTSCQKGDPG